jgi:beta-glucosidase
MAKKKLTFPKGFLWGAATSAHQIEGANRNNWSVWEKKNAKRLANEAKIKLAKCKTGKACLPSDRFPEMFDPKNYISGRACDHYNRYEEDFDIAKSLGLNAFRISIEWSRIEPAEGKFDEREIEHYRKVLEAIRARGMEPFVTLWHWTLPLWLAEKGGVASEKFPKYFERYAERIAKEFSDSTTFWLTLNEPTAVIGASYSAGVWPPQKKNPLAALGVYKNLSCAHNLAYAIIRKTSKRAKVGFVNILNFLDPYNKNSLLDKLSVKIGNYFSNKKFLNLTKKSNDFLAVDYYFHHRVKFPFAKKNENKEVSDLGWEIYPEGIYHILKDLGRYNLPIYITENGLADADDKKRAKFIKDHLRWTHKAVSEGADVRGYFHWSLLDNFEWDKGFWPRFGLVEVDYETLERKIRPSAWEYAKICKNNYLETRFPSGKK